MTFETPVQETQQNANSHGSGFGVSQKKYPANFIRPGISALKYRIQSKNQIETIKGCLHHTLFELFTGY